MAPEGHRARSCPDVGERVLGLVVSVGPRQGLPTCGEPRLPFIVRLGHQDGYQERNIRWKVERLVKLNSLAVVVGSETHGRHTRSLPEVCRGGKHVSGIARGITESSLMVA